MTIPTGNRPASDGGDDEYFPPPTNPMAVARRILPDWSYSGMPTLRHWRGRWMRWEGPRWTETDDTEMRSALYRRLERAEFVATNVRGDEEVRPWAPSKRKISDLVEATAAITHLPSSVDPPAWAGRPDVTGPVVACRNGLLDVPSRALSAHSPEFFNLVSVPFDFDQDAPAPVRWLGFLDQLWPDDESSVALLREFFGYVVSGRTDMQKILLLVGPTRSGKGTIARVLTALVGRGNVAGPTLASLGTQFGLMPLLGKPLAVVSDARLDPRGGHLVVESLLRISGEDSIDVDVKFREPWSGRLPTRFAILSNEIPKFGDDSGVIADRFLVLSMRTSFLGREDPGLTDAITAELPGILNWSLDGLAALVQRGRFAEPAGSADARLTMKDMASPVSAFVRDRCTLGPDHETTVDRLWTAWKSWCDEAGNHPGNRATFGRNLQAVAPQVRRTRPRDDTGRQTPTYTGITLAGTSHIHHAQPPVSPDSAGPRACAESAETGETGNFPLRAQHEANRSAAYDAAPISLPDLGPRASRGRHGPGTDTPPEWAPCLGCGRPALASADPNAFAVCPDCAGPGTDTPPVTCIACRLPLSHDDGTHTHPTCAEDTA